MDRLQASQEQSLSHVHTSMIGTRDQSVPMVNATGEKKESKVYIDAEEGGGGKETRLHHSLVNYYGALPPAAAAAVFATRSSTRSLCWRFRRWTSKLSTVVPGPGVYNLPGQSWQRMRGRYWYFSLWPGWLLEFATGSMVSVSTAV